MCSYILSIFLGQFLGDIAIPNTSSYSKQTKEEAALQAEVERYKKEVLEGLQIEEEGLTDLIRRKTKQLPTLDSSRAYNDPVDGYGSTQKNGQILKNAFDSPQTDSSVNDFAHNMRLISTEGYADISSTEAPKRKHKKRHAIYYHKKNRRQRAKNKYAFNYFFVLKINVVCL